MQKLILPLQLPLQPASLETETSLKVLRLGPVCLAHWRQLGLSILLGLAGTAQAFDTGHHADLSREVLTEFGMNDTAIRVAQVENWLVDYYSSSPTSAADVESQVAKLHADNLFSLSAVTNYWDRYATNAKSAFEEAARNNDPRQVLALLGMSLHTVQDFYTHSNWAELQAPPAGSNYATLTWFDSTAAQRTGVKTGKASTSNDTSQTPHGGYNDGMNHDFYGRPNWDRAYVLAYAAERQWVNQAKLWVSSVNPTLWDKARTITLEGKYQSRLNSDYTAMYRLSEWVKTSSDNGHWKGSGSGVTSDFSTFAASWVAFTLDSVFVEDFKNRKWHQLLSGGLRGSLDLSVNAPPPASAPAISRFALNKRAVFLKTEYVKDLNNVDSALVFSGDADFYAKITINNQEFVEAMQLDKSSIHPAWTIIKFMDISTAIVHYELWDEDGSLRGDDDHLDLHPDRRFKDLDFLYNLDNHQMGGNGIEGVFDSPARLFSTQGTDSDRAHLEFYITTKTLAPTIVRTFPVDVFSPFPPVIKQNQP